MGFAGLSEADDDLCQAEFDKLPADARRSFTLVRSPEDLDRKEARTYSSTTRVSFVPSSSFCQRLGVVPKHAHIELQRKHNDWQQHAGVPYGRASSIGRETIISAPRSSGASRGRPAQGQGKGRPTQAGQGAGAY